MSRTASHSCWANRRAIITADKPPKHAWRCAVCSHRWLQGEAAQPENAGLDTRAVTPGPKCRRRIGYGITPFSVSGMCNRPLPCPDHPTLQAVT